MGDKKNAGLNPASRDYPNRETNVEGKIIIYVNHRKARKQGEEIETEHRFRLTSRRKKNIGLFVNKQGKGGGGR